jgi:hypothetical protein
VGWAGATDLVAQPAVSLKAVADAWEARETRIRSFRVVVRRSETYSPGAILGPDFPDQKNPKRMTIPPQTTTYESSYTIVVEGGKMRIESNGLGVSHEDGLVPQMHMAVSNGEVVKCYLPTGLSPYPTGSVWEGTSNPRATTTDYLPVLLTFRPFHPAMASFTRDELLSPARFTIDSRRTPMERRNCICLKELPSPKRAGYVRSFWLDPEREYSLMRYTVQAPMDAGGRVVVQLDSFEYEQNGSTWVPTAWRMVDTNPRGAIRQSTMAKVERYSLNPPVEPEEFDIAFPPGTWVTQTLGKDRGGPRVQYIVREGGEKRVITENEQSASYEQLLRSESGNAFQAGRERSGWGKYWASLGALAFLLAAVVLAARLRSRARTR